MPVSAYAQKIGSPGRHRQGNYWDGEFESLRENPEAEMEARGISMGAANAAVRPQVRAGIAGDTRKDYSGHRYPNPHSKFMG